MMPVPLYQATLVLAGCLDRASHAVLEVLALGIPSDLVQKA